MYERSNFFYGQRAVKISAAPGKKLGNSCARYSLGRGRRRVVFYLSGGERRRAVRLLDYTGALSILITLFLLLHVWDEGVHFYDRRKLIKKHNMTVSEVFRVVSLCSCGSAAAMQNIVTFTKPARLYCYRQQCACFYNIAHTTLRTHLKSWLTSFMYYRIVNIANFHKQLIPACTRLRPHRHG